ncbi:MAG: MoaD/ThiS family protein [Syntrophobacteraceae bacterium]|nr:MoaD/ThiS family protein [Desulfobacteraceae bacterium]
MVLKVFLAATLRKYVPGYDSGKGHEVEVEPGETAGDVAARLHIPQDEVRLIMIDGIGSNWDAALDEAERLAFFPPVGGG